MAKNAYGRRWWRGVLLENRVISALEWVERKSGLKIVPTQGSFSTSVDASGNTHAGGGAVDLSVRHHLTPNQWKVLDHWMRRAGFAGWLRPEIAGLWPVHYHAILLGTKTASPAAKSQMASYRNHRNGLANNAWDNAWRPRVPRRWNHRLNRPVLHPLPGQKLTPGQKKLLPDTHKLKKSN